MGLEGLSGVPSTEDEAQNPSQTNQPRTDSQEAVRAEKEWSWFSGGIQGVLLRSPNMAKSRNHSRFRFLSVWAGVEDSGLEPASDVCVLCGFGKVS